MQAPKTITDREKAKKRNTGAYSQKMSETCVSLRRLSKLLVYCRAELLTHQAVASWVGVQASAVGCPLVQSLLVAQGQSAGR